MDTHLPRRNIDYLIFAICMNDLPSTVPTASSSFLDDTPMSRKDSTTIMLSQSSTQRYSYVSPQAPFKIILEVSYYPAYIQANENFSVRRSLNKKGADLQAHEVVVLHWRIKPSKSGAVGDLALLLGIVKYVVLKVKK